MAISVDPLTFVITVPKDYTTLIQTNPTEIREMNINTFRLDLKDWEDGNQGMVSTKTHLHNTEVTLQGINYARTVEIIEPYTITFEDGQYAVNLVGANNNLSDRINKNQVAVNTSNSAGLISSPAIEYASFDGGVWIDQTVSTTGTLYNKGTPENPVNNLTDAHEIAESRGFTRFFFNSDYTFDGTENLNDSYEFHGQGAQQTVFTFSSGAIYPLSEVHNATVTGVVDGINGFTDCKIKDIAGLGSAPSSVDLLIQRCLFEGSFTVPSNYSGVISVVDSWALPDTSQNPPVFDMGDSNADLQLRNWSGIANIKNNTNENDIRVFLTSGGVILDSTITAGNILLSGVGLLTDNSTSVTTLNIDGLMNKENITDITFDRVYLDVDNGSAGTDFPLGNPGTPVDNLTDALTIAARHNVSTIMLGGTLTLDQDVGGKEFISWKNGKIDLNNQPCLATRFRECKVTGTMNSLALFFDCRIDNVQNINGNMYGCYFLNNTSMTVAAGAQLLFDDCRSAVPGSNSPTFDLSAGGGIGFNCRAYSGGIKINNSTDPTNIATFEFIAGKFNFNDTNTAGDFHVRGVLDTTGIDPEAGADLSYTGSVTTNRELEYNGTIHCHLDATETGAVYPFGLPGTPTNNLADALILATTYGAHQIHMQGDLTITTGQDVSGLTIIADRSLGNSVTVNSGAITDGTYFTNLTVSGEMGGSVRYTTCVLGTITNFDGGAKDSLLTGDITITGTGANYFTNCDTYVTDATYKSIDVGDKLLNILRARGSWEIANNTGSSLVACDFVDGNVHIASSCTAGQILISGLVRLIDESGAGCFVIDGTLTQSGVADDVWDSLLADHEAGGTFGGELATKADILASASTDYTTATSATIVEGSVGAGVYTNMDVRDGVYWQIDEDAANGMIMEATFNIPNDSIAGTVELFGRYEGTPATSHYQELWAYNYESAAWEQLQEEFLPGGNTSDSLQTHEYFERHIDRANNNEVKIRTIHNVATYNAGHEMYIDYLAVSSINPITASEIVDGVWNAFTTTYTTAGTMGKAMSDAGSSGNPWATPIAGNTTAGSFGELVGKKLLTLAKWIGLK